VRGGCISGRGLHSFTFRLNVSPFCGIGGAFMGSLGGVRGCQGVPGGVQGEHLFQIRLRLS